jgi:glycosyltransferase involved in cell wall biosynthesis
MRIAWCTPYSRHSAIGRVSSLIVEELLRLAEVDIWHPQTAEPLETPARRITPLMGGHADAALLAKYDVAVYNMGNHLGNHREIFEAARRTAGIVILHDLALQNFFSAYYLGNADLQTLYASAVKRWYGERGAAAVSDLVAGISSDFLGSPDVLEFPLFEEAIAGSYGVVTHSNFSADRVRKVFPGLVRHMPLPYKVNRRIRIPPRDSLGIPAGRILAITVGDVNTSKRIRAVIETLGNDQALAARIFYVVIGNPAPAYESELMHMVNKFGLTNSVRFAGIASEELLGAYLTYADFCITLRYPALETSSAIAIEQLAYGKPLIVSKTGFYEELPDDCVLKVRIDHEVEDLRSAMERLTNDPLLRQRMSKRARPYAREVFRADRYARAILELGQEMLDAKPLLAFTDRIGKELGRMGVSSGMPLVATVAAESSALFEE